MKPIPNYALYGEADADREQDWLHWETIQSRSRLHDYLIAPHRHEQFFQVLHLTGGLAHVTIDGVTFDLQPPAIVVVPALTVHGYLFSTDVEGLVVTLMERDARAAGLGEIGPAILPDASEVGEAVDRLIAEADRPGAGHNVAMRALLALLIVAIERARPLPDAESKATGDRGVLHAKAFRWLVDQRFRQTRRLADYASELAISPTHLNRISRQVLGASALAVIERRVALEARRMLQFSSLSIKQIGADLGYEDPAYFTRVLTRVLGMTPGRYRATARAGQRP
ncbi:helix-turn-helix domain-containing protein [Devosia nitrariae]|nr:helix-turn-helix domain-containing protein [Devosia nitrariae]